MKVLTILSMIVRLAFLAALIIGLGFWFGWWIPNDSLRGIHMSLGIIFVLGLWGVGLAQGFALKQNGSFALGLLTFVVGLAVAIVGIGQDSWRASIGVEAMNSIHLVLNILAIGVAEMVAGRSRRIAKAQVAA